MWWASVVSAACGISCANSAIRCSLVEMASELNVSTIGLSNDSQLRHRLPSTGSPGVGSPASRVLRSAPTPCPPSGRASSPSLGRTALGSLVAPGRGEPACLGLGLDHPVVRPGCCAKTTGSPKFLWNPPAYVPRSPIPAGLSPRGPSRTELLPSVATTTSGAPGGSRRSTPTA
jgi:hypothetical protein